MHVMDSFRKRVKLSDERKREILEEHMKIYKAISDKDVTRARKFMIEHLINAEKEIKLSDSQKDN